MAKTKKTIKPKKKNKPNKRMKDRPPRIMLTKQGRAYVMIGKKRVYLKTDGVSQKQLVNVVINNFKKKGRKTNPHKQEIDRPQLIRQADYLSFLNHTFLNKKEDAEKIIKDIEYKITRALPGPSSIPALPGPSSIPESPFVLSSMYFLNSPFFKIFSLLFFYC